MPNIKTTFRRLKGESEKMGKKTLYIENKVFDDFKEICAKEGYSVSESINDMIKQAVEEIRASNKGGEDQDKAADEMVQKRLGLPSDPLLLEAIRLLKSLDPEALDSATGLLRKAAKHSAYLKKTK